MAKGLIIQQQQQLSSTLLPYLTAGAIAPDVAERVLRGIDKATAHAIYELAQALLDERSDDDLMVSVRVEVIPQCFRATLSLPEND